MSIDVRSQRFGGSEERSAGAALLDALGRQVPALLVLSLLVFFVLIIHRIHTKPLWYDEFFTALVAMQPNWRAFLGAMAAEGNPPLNTLLTKGLFHLFGVNLVALRLVSLLGYIGSLVGIFVFVRREAGQVYGLLALLLLLAESAWVYSFEARPYGLMLAMLMLALTGWQAAASVSEIDPHRSRWLALTVMCLGIAGCILSHNIGIVTVGVPLLIGEGVRSFERRRLDWPVLATALSALPALAIIIPAVHRTQQAILVRASYIVQPLTLWKLIAYRRRITETTHLIFSRNLLIVIALSLLICWIMRKHSSARSQAVPDASAVRPSHRYILASAMAALLLVPITWLVLIPAGGWYFTRYGIGSIIGLSVVVCLLLRHWKAHWILVGSLMLVSLILFARNYVAYVPENPLDQRALGLVQTDTSSLPIIVADPLEFPAVWWYAPQSARGRLFYVKGGSDGFASVGYGVVQAAVMAERPYTSAHISDFEEFAQKHDRALLYAPQSPHAFLGKWRERGYSVTPVAESLYVYLLAR
jgi:hypothetical protein